MGPASPLLSLLLMMTLCWVHRHQSIAIESVQAEDRSLRERQDNTDSLPSQDAQATMARMSHMRWASTLFWMLVVSSVASPHSLLAAEYPERPVTMVIAYPPGGGADALGRIVARQMGEILNRPVTVVNRSGAAGTIGAAYVAASAPDGYTIFFAESSLLVAPHIYGSLTFDVNSFTAVAPVGSLPFAI